MTQRDDILLNESNEVDFLGGDFLVGVSDQQHVRHIIEANKGHYYQNPFVGLGANDLINGTINRDELRQDIKIQLKADNYRPLQVFIDSNFDVFINAEPLTV